MGVSLSCLSLFFFLSPSPSLPPPLKSIIVSLDEEFKKVCEPRDRKQMRGCQGLGKRVEWIQVSFWGVKCPGTREW